jgi:hypothetical protein
MQGAYAVGWHERDGLVEGRLRLVPHALRLESLEDRDQVLCELPLERISGLRIRDLDGIPGRTRLELETSDSCPVSIESIVGKWIFVDLVQAAVEDGLAGGGRNAFLVAVRLEPARRDEAIALLRAGPPFEPSETTLSSHEVFVLDDEIVFLFETEDRDATREEGFELFDAALAWQKVIRDVRIGECVYAWRRVEPPSIRSRLVGLGF